MKSSDYEVIAHCLIALEQISRNPSSAEVKRALSESQLALDLSGNDDWHCHLTNAVCLAAANQKEAAIAAGERAGALAIGNKKQICREITDKIKLDQDVVWQY